jgi:histidine triad (HIT) family protein
MEDCIFCKIARGELPAHKVFENDKIVAFNDINPKAKVHILIIPNKHIESVQTLEPIDKDLIGELFLIANKIAKMEDLKGCRIVVNVGKEGGQIVNHLHLHLLSPDAKLGV